MKERLINVIKWFFIILGVLFFVQLLLVLGAIVGINNFAKADFNVVGNQNQKIKEIQPIINYAENYRKENGKYPEKVENIKVKKNLNYKYEISKDGNCYTISTKTEKNNTTRQYQRCKVDSNNSASSTESYIEFNK